MYKNNRHANTKQPTVAPTTDHTLVASASLPNTFFQLVSPLLGRSCQSRRGTSTSGKCGLVPSVRIALPPVRAFVRAEEEEELEDDALETVDVEDDDDMVSGPTVTAACVLPQPCTIIMYGNHGVHGGKREGKCTGCIAP